MKILLIIVLYKCKLRDSISFNCVCNQISIDKSLFSFYIYDNSPVIDTEADSLLRQYPMSIYFNDINNSGISKAYNKASEYAAKNNFNWLLLLDQDTMLPTNLLSSYIRAINNNPQINLFVPRVKIKDNKYISPCFYYLKQGHIMRKIPCGLLKIRHYSVINSGIMISLQSFSDLGGYNERVYLDYSDHEFIARFKKKYKYVYVIDNDIIQNFACVSTNLHALVDRYRILCDCVNNIHRDSRLDDILYSIMLFKRAVHLAIKTKHIIFLKIFCNYRLSKKYE